MQRTTTIIDLRERAEARLARPPRGLLHRELELHKLELEMQNDELRRTHDELERARDRYRELFEAAPIAYLSLDIGGRICAANRAATELTGLTNDQLLGIRLAGLLRVDDSDRLHLFLGGLPADGTTRLAVDLLHPDGGRRHVVLEASRTHEGILAIVQENRSADTAVHETRQLAALGASTSTIAHEVNNLLHVIGASLAEVETKLADESALAAVHDGRETLMHCKELVSRLLVFGLSEEPRRRDVVLDDLIARTIVMLRPMLGQSIQIEHDLGAPGARVSCDPVEIELVLINLAANAHDAMPAGGRLTIGTRIQTRGGEPRSLVLVVEDTGDGMSAEVQRRVFEPFFTTKRAGNGLGLATCRGIVDRANGTISVRSAPRAGTTFEIVLPLAGSEQRFALGTESRPCLRLVDLEGEIGQSTILVVEDNATARLAVHEHLAAIGYRVLVADTLEAALEIARTHSIDLALLDYRLRSISGDLLARQLRELHPDLRVLLTSGYPRSCITTSVKHFLQKPFSLDQLSQAVATVLGT